MSRATHSGVRAERLLQELAIFCAEEDNAEGAACLFDALLYLADREHYWRLTMHPAAINLDLWLRDALRGRPVKTIRCRWNQREVETVRTMYRDTPTRAIAELLGRPVSGVYNVAGKLGTGKSPELIALEAKANMAKPGHRGKLFQFKPGTAPPNKGVRRPGYAPGRMAETQFRKGARPHTWLPVGSVRPYDGGYLWRKVSDTGDPERDWRPCHHMLWEEAHGPVPEGHALVFRDGNRKHVVLDNLELITRGELMRRNTIHNLPKELVEVIHLTGQLKRVIRNKEKRHEEQDERYA